MERDWFKQVLFFVIGSCAFFFCLSVYVLANDVRGLKDGVVKIIAHVNGQSKVGTGVVIRQDADAVFIATASHVIEGDPKPTVQLSILMKPGRSKIFLWSWIMPPG